MNAHTAERKMFSKRIPATTYEYGVGIIINIIFTQSNIISIVLFILRFILLYVILAHNIEYQVILCHQQQLLFIVYYIGLYFVKIKIHTLSNWDKNFHNNIQGVTERPNELNNLYSNKYIFLIYRLIHYKL